MRKTAIVLALAALLAGIAAGQEKKSTVKNTPAFEMLKSFAGTWTGTVTEPGGQGAPAALVFRVVSDGSAVMLEHNPGSKDDNMITMFYPDGEQVLGTHYCSAHNQPHMKLTSAAGNKLTFETVSVTNLDHPGDGHMARLVITQVAPDHQVQEWTYMDNGKEMTGKFDMHRVHDPL